MFCTTKEYVESIFQYFRGKFPNVSDNDLYKRISNHYEGGLFDIWTIEDWTNALNYTKQGHLFTLFKDWDEYFKYNGNYKKRPNFSDKNWHFIS